jgi:hypothetical protein
MTEPAKAPATDSKGKDDEKVVVLLYRGLPTYDFSSKLWWMKECPFKHSTRKFSWDTHEQCECPHQHAHGLVKRSELTDISQPEAQKT